MEELDKIVRDNINRLDTYRAPDNFTNRVMQQVYLKHQSFSSISTSLRASQIVLLVFGILLMWAAIFVLFWNAIDFNYLAIYGNKLITVILSNTIVRYSLMAIIIHFALIRVLLFVPFITKRKISIRF
jgi:hypothetical protein